MRILGVIPARGGSKGIPDKNIYPLNGKLLINYTIEAAQQSKLTDFIVTTDSMDIAERIHPSCKYILRPPELAQDDTPMLPTIQHAVKEYGLPFDAVMVLQPTSPLRTFEDINSAIALFDVNKQDSLVSVCDGVHPMKSYDLRHRPFMDQIPYDKHMHGCLTRNGAIFIASMRLLNNNRIFDANPVFYYMPKTRSIDIDSYDDMQIAEALLRS